MKKDESMDIYFYIMGWIVSTFVAVMIVVITVYGTGFLNKFPKCGFRTLTGFYCPGCGGTRATFAFFRGHWIKAFKFHPVVPYAGIFCGWFMISQTIERITRHRIKIAMHFRDVYIWIGVALVLGNWVVKNIFILFGIYLLG